MCCSTEALRCRPTRVNLRWELLSCSEALVFLLLRQIQLLLLRSWKPTPVSGPPREGGGSRSPQHRARLRGRCAERAAGVTPHREMAAAGTGRWPRDTFSAGAAGGVGAAPGRGCGLSPGGRRCLFQKPALAGPAGPAPRTGSGAGWANWALLEAKPSPESVGQAAGAPRHRSPVAGACVRAFLRRVSRIPGEI